MAGTGKKANKNQTAAERAVKNRVPSGHDCEKCGQGITRDELRMVRRISYTPSGRQMTVMAPFHIKCYALG